MEHTGSENHTLLSILLAATAFLTEVARRLIDNYDVTFKLLTLTMLTLAVVVNMDKAIRVIFGYCYKAYKWARKK
jgi:hypothetical protein